LEENEEIEDINQRFEQNLEKEFLKEQFEILELQVEL
jgi:hypothetical protein